MIGWVSQWPALVLLLVWAAAPAAVEGVDELKLKSMDWTYDDTDGTTYLKVCTEDTPLDGTITLTLTDSMSKILDGTFFGSLDSNDDTCALFDTPGNQPLPAAMTTYELSTRTLQEGQQSGSVSFSLEGATITCGSSTFLRFNPGAGTVDTAVPCTILGSVCYVTDGYDPSENICFDEHDDLNPNFNVCIQRKAFVVLAPITGSLTADELKYDGGSFTFTYDNVNPPLAELLILSDDTPSSLTVVSCDTSTCDETGLLPSTAKYNLCGVFVDTGVAVSSGEASFQDTDLQVDKVGDSAIDFHFINSNDDKLYFVSGLGGTNQPIEEFSLDCNHITTDTICNGFFDDNLDKIVDIAVSFVDENEATSNTIIAPVPS